MLANLTNNQNEEWTASPIQNNPHHMQGAGMPPAAELPVLHAPSCCPAVRAELVTVSMGPQSMGEAAGLRQACQASDACQEAAYMMSICLVAGKIQSVRPWPVHVCEGKCLPMTAE